MNTYRKICVVFSNFVQEIKNWRDKLSQKSLKKCKSTSFVHWLKSK